MRTASMVLGIVGGAMAVMAALLYIFCLSPLYGSDYFGTLYGYSDYTFDFGNFFNMFQTLFTVFGVMSIIGGILGLIGGIIVKKRNVAAGVLMIIAAVLTFSLLFILGGIFALVKEKQPQPYPPYPPAPPAPPQA